jgi:RimJ/RimL family protein N-acetyltransferase
MPHRYYIIKGKKAALSIISKEDLPLFVSWLNDPEVTVYLSMRRVITPEGEEEWYERVRKDPHCRHFSIVALPMEEVIGVAGLDRIDPYDGSASFGIFIGRKGYWGKGYGTEATILMLDYAFNCLGLHHIWLIVKDFNKRALRCYKKVGFKEVGRLREAILQPDGRHDIIIMDMLARDFNKTHRSRFKSIQENA